MADGVLRNPSFTDYLIPTILGHAADARGRAGARRSACPYGLRGVGEPPDHIVDAAIVAAIRAATGRALSRVPVRPGAHHRWRTEMLSEDATKTWSGSEDDRHYVGRSYPGERRRGRQPCTRARAGLRVPSRCYRRVA